METEGMFCHPRALQRRVGVPPGLYILGGIRSARVVAGSRRVRRALPSESQRDPRLFALLGMGDVKGHDGSWTQWGGIVGFPVEPG